MVEDEPHISKLVESRETNNNKYRGCVKRWTVRN